MTSGPVSPADASTGRVLRSDYDADPTRFAANQSARDRYLQGLDVHHDVARRFADLGLQRVVDIGGGNGALARLLHDVGISTMVVDPAEYVDQAPRPAVRADARRLPFAADTFDGAACLYMLYHLVEPVTALLEAHRVLRQGGHIAVCAPSRFNDPELADVLPDWGKALTFDAENGPGQVGAVFDQIVVERWEAPLVRLPDTDALALYLRGRGLTPQASRAAAHQMATPLTLTKRGLLALAQK
jgi:SAM-dependent methyltransferase